MLEYRTLWNQPMFLAHGTFIIGFSVAKNHLCISPEAKGITHFTSEIQAAGYSHTKNLFRISWQQEVDFALIEKIIKFNLHDKKDCPNFWSK